MDHLAGSQSEGSRAGMCRVEQQSYGFTPVQVSHIPLREGMPSYFHTATTDTQRGRVTYLRVHTYQVAALGFDQVLQACGDHVPQHG